MQKTKPICWTIVGLVLVVLLVSGFIKARSLYRQMMDSEIQGHSYRVFFAVVDAYTAETGHMPESFDDLRAADITIDGGTIFWPADAPKLASLIQPDFSVEVKRENLNAFVPGYQTKATWADYLCEGWWEKIVENCDQEPW